MAWHGTALGREGDVRLSVHLPSCRSITATICFSVKKYHNNCCRFPKAWIPTTLISVHPTAKKKKKNTSHLTLTRYTKMSYVYLCHGHLWYQAYHLTDSAKANNTPKMSNCSWQSFMVSDNPDICWILANSKTINRHEVLKKTFGCALKLYGAKLTIYKCVCSLKVPGKKMHKPRE